MSLSKPLEKHLDAAVVFSKLRPSYWQPNNARFLTFLREQVPPNATSARARELWKDSGGCFKEEVKVKGKLQDMAPEAIEQRLKICLERRNRYDPNLRPGSNDLVCAQGLSEWDSHNKRNGLEATFKAIVNRHNTAYHEANPGKEPGQKGAISLCEVAAFEQDGKRFVGHDELGWYLYNQAEKVDKFQKKHRQVKNQFNRKKSTKKASSPKSQGVNASLSSTCAQDQASWLSAPETVCEADSQEALDEESKGDSKRKADCGSLVQLADRRRKKRVEVQNPQAHCSIQAAAADEQANANFAKIKHFLIDSEPDCASQIYKKIQDTLSHTAKCAISSWVHVYVNGGFIQDLFPGLPPPGTNLQDDNPNFSPWTGGSHVDQQILESKVQGRPLPLPRASGASDTARTVSFDEDQAVDANPPMKHEASSAGGALSHDSILSTGPTTGNSGYDIKNAQPCLAGSQEVVPSETSLLGTALGTAFQSEKSSITQSLFAPNLSVHHSVSELGEPVNDFTNEYIGKQFSGADHGVSNSGDDGSLDRTYDLLDAPVGCLNNSPLPGSLHNASSESPQNLVQIIVFGKPIATVNEPPFSAHNQNLGLGDPVDDFTKEYKTIGKGFSGAHHGVSNNGDDGRDQPPLSVQETTDSTLVARQLSNEGDQLANNGPMHPHIGDMAAGSPDGSVHQPTGTFLSSTDQLSDYDEPIWLFKAPSKPLLERPPPIRYDTDGFQDMADVKADGMPPESPQNSPEQIGTEFPILTEAEVHALLDEDAAD